MGDGLGPPTGELFSQLDAAFTDALGRLTIGWRWRLPPELWSLLVSEFAKGKAHTVYIVTMKTENWTQLPWLLCVLGNFNEDVAREGARDCGMGGDVRLWVAGQA